MKRAEPKEGFDCVQFKRQAQARMYGRIKDLSPAEEMDTFAHAAAQGPLADGWKAVQGLAARRPGP